LEHEKRKEKEKTSWFIPYSIGRLLRHQIPRSKLQRDQAESSDPKICFLDCYHPKISILYPHNGMRQSWGDDWPDIKSYIKNRYLILNNERRKTFKAIIIKLTLMWKSWVNRSLPGKNEEETMGHCACTFGSCIVTTLSQFLRQKGRKHLPLVTTPIIWWYDPHS
jgi:hypothetical protein